MNLKIYLFRHGQTYFNRDQRFTGWKDSKLTPQGYKDAKKVAKLLKNKKIDIAYSSHLTRSKETLKEVLKYHPECHKKIVDDRIIERSYGNLQGKYHKKFIKEHGRALFDKYHRAYDFPPPKGESVKQVEKRVNSFIKDLLKKMKKEKVNVAISAHGNSMRPFRKYFEKLTQKQMMKIENPWDNYFEYTIKVPTKKMKKTKKEKNNEKRKKCILASDHAGRIVKENAEKALIELGIDYEDYSPTNTKMDDYPDFAEEVGEKIVKQKEKEFGILVCGSGIGMSIAANKIKGIRAALLHTKKEAELARKDNDANILVLPGSYSPTKLTYPKIKEIIKAFYETNFKELKRFKRRINKIKKLEK